MRTNLFVSLVVYFLRRPRRAHPPPGMHGGTQDGQPGVPPDKTLLASLWLLWRPTHCPLYVSRTMDETSTHLDGRRRRLLFRAQHRGTRENDLLVGGFVAPRLGSFSADEISVLERIMELPDTWLADWLTGRTPIPPEHDGALLRAMRDARGQGPDA